jgi:anti-anti-sigma factor
VSIPAPSERQTWRLTIARGVEQGTLVVAVGDRLGAASSGVLIEALVGAIQEGHRRIVCDLENVDYASSAGLLALLAVAGRMHQAGGRLVLSGLSDPVRVVLDLADVLPQFETAPSRDEAIDRMRGEET